MDVDELSMVEMASDSNFLSSSSLSPSSRKRAVPESDAAAKRPCLSGVEPQGLQIRDSKGNIHVFRERISVIVQPPVSHACLTRPSGTE